MSGYYYAQLVSGFDSNIIDGGDADALQVLHHQLPVGPGIDMNFLCSRVLDHCDCKEE